MGKIKTVAAYSNPFLYIAGAPVMVGIIIAAMFDGVIKKTTRVLKALDF